MRRRQFLICGIAALTGTAARAQDYPGQIVRHLQTQGYTRIESTRTWLGRVRILASRADAEREIVLNPRTGEVLRDLLIVGGRPRYLLPDDDSAYYEEEDDNGGRGRGRGRGGDDDDDRDDDDDDEDSGHGGGDDDDD